MVGVGGGEQHRRRVAQLDDDIECLYGQTFAGADDEWDVGPLPVVDEQPQCGKGLGGRSGPHAAGVQVAGVLATDQIGRIGGADRR
ncbi:MAG TPA: hypothetical protein VGO16_13800 [Pseudonocardiaceae bacterium]|jgi:hypothetical protein|nr:hypothetical protein [Pseudonocardiaceae bacterium]